MQRICLLSCLVMMGLAVIASPIKSGIGARETSSIKGEAKLPYDAVVEYIQTRGQQWIDTGYVPTSVMPAFELVGMCPYDTTFHMGMQNPIYAFAVCVRNLNNSYGEFTARINSVSGQQKSSGYFYATTFKLTSTVINLVCNNLSIPITSITLSNNAQPLCLFRGNGSNSRSGVKIRYFRLWENDVLLLDLIPVRYTDNLGEVDGGMYDRISGRLFRNSGTGTFIVGPDTVEEE